MCCVTACCDVVYRVLLSHNMLCYYVVWCGMLCYVRLLCNVLSVYCVLCCIVLHVLFRGVVCCVVLYCLL